MGRILLGIVLLAFLVVNVYVVVDSLASLTEITTSRRFGDASAIQVTQVYTESLHNIALGTFGVLADMLFLLIINFMDTGWKERRRKKQRAAVKVEGSI